MRHPQRLLLLCALLVLPFGGCIEDRLSVELFTQIHADGTCTRRVEYRLERVDTKQGDRPAAIPPDDSPLRKNHRLPSGEAWRIDEETGEGFHSIVIEATLPSPNDFDGDFYRARTTTSPPTRNFISAYTDPEEAAYEYREVLRDPMSPVTGARILARQLARRDEEFARYVIEVLGQRAGAPGSGDLRQAFLGHLARPFAEDVSRLRKRPLYGPREQRELDDVVENLEMRQRDLEIAVRDLAPGTPVDDLDQAVDTAMERLGEALMDDADTTGVNALLGLQTGEIRFRATLVMPYPIHRANTCAVGDTAVWEFDGAELVGRGFEMTALASAP